MRGDSPRERQFDEEQRNRELMARVEGSVDEASIETSTYTLPVVELDRDEVEMFCADEGDLFEKNDCCYISSHQ